MGHNASQGCQKCTVRGRRINNRLCFFGPNYPKRTDFEFRTRNIAAHHKEYSILEQMPINMIDDFVVAEDLHLFHLGVMKKCILMWKEGPTESIKKWTDDEIKTLNRMLKSINNDMPTEIHRSLRDINYIKHWKGCELRTFLLYVGPIVLKYVIKQDEYKHFIKLFCAVTLCSTDTYLNNNKRGISNLIRVLFNEYVEEFGELYGIEFISSNVHNLKHVIDDILKFGNLTKISAYCFENCLAALKLRLRNCNRPLEQISRRISELNLDYRVPIDFEEMDSVKDPLLKNPIENEAGAQVFSQILFGSNVLLNSQKNADKWFLTDSGNVIEFHFCLKRNAEHFLYGSGVENLESFFTQPITSTKINIFLVSKENASRRSAIQPYNIQNVKAKMICIRDDGKMVFMPLLHTLK